MAETKFKTQTIEESTHWISFNLKALVQEMKTVNSNLESIKNYFADKRDSNDTNDRF
jgi:hypothetical protein